MSEKMVWEIVSRGNNPICAEAYVSVRKSGLKLSVGFERMCDISRRNYSFVRIKRNSENRCLLLEFFTLVGLQEMTDNLESIDGIYPLLQDGGPKRDVSKQRSGGRVINCGKVILDTDWLYVIARERQHTSRRFIPEPTNFQNQWIVRFMHVFTRESEAENCAVDVGIKGIYRYLDDEGKVLYIGQGNIAQRYAAHAREKEIPAKLFQWTPIGDLASRMRAEAFHLQTHLEKFGCLPKWNRVLGMADKNMEAIRLSREHLLAPYRPIQVGEQESK